MKKEFSYLEKGGQYFPIIEVVVGHSGRALAVRALVDSGATFSVFQPEVAEYLGVEIKRGQKIHLSGIGGRILGYLHNMDLDLAGQRFKCKIVFSPAFNVSFNLLGRDNFFAPFVISFAEAKRKIIMSAA